MTWRVTVLLAALCLSGCLMSQQDGQAIPELTASVSNQTAYVGDVSFHFRGVLNGLFVLVRLLLACLFLWLALRAWRAPERQRALIAVLVTLGLAGMWLFGRGVVTMAGYRIEVKKTGLSISIPFHTDVDAPWDRVYGVHAAGTTRGRDTPYSRPADGYTEWQTMKLVLAGAKVHEIDLERLTFAQRMNLLRAIEYRSGMERSTLP